MNQLYKFIFPVILFVTIITACSSNEQPSFVSKQKESTENEKLLKQKDKELELKEKELMLKEKELDILKIQINNKPKNLNEIYNRVKKSVYLVYIENSEMKAFGSAFVISPDGLAISNFHVFENASSAVAYNEDNKEYLVTEIIDYNKEQDYIIFRIGPINKELPFLQIADSKSEIGENCFAVGNPEGLTQTLSNGIISSYRDNGNLIQMTTEITHGSSGGPLFNSTGEVIGITTSGMGEANLNFAVNINRLPIFDLLSEENNIESHYLSKDEIKLIISNYYNVLSNEDFENLESFYTSTLKRYYTHFDISSIEVIQSAKRYKEKYEVISAKNTIRWDTFKIEEINGISRVEFIMDYELLRKDKSKPSTFVLSIIIEINSNSKIQSIYENILLKY